MTGNPSATGSGSAAYAARFRGVIGTSAYTPLGSTGLTVSRLGFGGYRVDDEIPEYRAALEQALQRGVNLVDTSTNYTDGGSERLVGAVLGDLVREGRLRREEVVVVTKIGYVQGENLRLAEAREGSGRPFPEMVKYMDGCWHCIHPEFLADQLARSRDRLGLGALDVCLLHNPEYFFSDAKRRHAGPLDRLREEFDRRLRAAFSWFEREVAVGTIRWYGVSSNTVAAPASDPEATALGRMLRAARDVGGAEHHFRVLQLPLNLFEAGGVFERNNPDGSGAGESVLDQAAREGMGVLVNRPLNASVGSGMLRLADVPLHRADATLPEQLRVVGALEAEYRREIAAGIEVAPGSMPPAEFFAWARRLEGLEERLQSLEHWRGIEGRMIGPAVGQVVRALDAGLSGPLAAGWRSWRDRYLPELERLLAAFRGRAAERGRAASRTVAAAVDPLLPAERRGETLSRKALWVLTSTPGVSVVLVGMRQPAYVDDAVGVLAWPPFENVLPVYQAVRRLAAPR